jgi:hypothetical protein
MCFFENTRKKSKTKDGDRKPESGDRKPKSKMRNPKLASKGINEAKLR